LWFQFSLLQVKLTARSFKKPNDRGFSSALLKTNINRPKQQRFILGYFMKFFQNVIFDFAPGAEENQFCGPMGF